MASLLPGRLEVTLALIAYATVLMIVISLPLGIVSALRKDGIFDQVTRAFLMVTLVMPAFWVGILFLTYFSIRLQLFPVAGYGEGWQEHLHHLFLPALTIALSIVPLIWCARCGPASWRRWGQTTCAPRAPKGCGSRRSSPPTCCATRSSRRSRCSGSRLAICMGGTVIVENVFSLPGAGKLLVDAIAARDYPLVQSTTLVFAVLVILVNLGTDVIYTFLDPRVQTVSRRR